MTSKLLSAAVFRVDSSMVSEGFAAGGKWVEPARCLRMPRLGVGHLNHSWRIGKLYYQFLRNTYGYVGEGMPDILSPFEMPTPCSTAELALVLGTRLRFVARFHEDLYCRWMLGWILLDPRTVSIPMPLRYSERSRNATFVCMFAVKDGLRGFFCGIVGLWDESHQFKLYLVAHTKILQSHQFLQLDPSHRIYRGARTTSFVSAFSFPPKNVQTILQTIARSSSSSSYSNLPPCPRSVFWFNSDCSSRRPLERSANLRNRSISFDDADNASGSHRVRLWRQCPETKQQQG